MVLSNLQMLPNYEVTEPNGTVTIGLRYHNLGRKSVNETGEKMAFCRDVAIKV